MFDLSLVRPLSVYSGSGEAEVPVGCTDDGTVLYETTSYDLDNDAQPLELGVTYLGAGGEWAPGRDYRYGLQLNWTDDVASGATDGTLGVLFSLKASFQRPVPCDPAHSAGRWPARNSPLSKPRREKRPCVPPAHCSASCA